MILARDCDTIVGICVIITHLDDCIALKSLSEVLLHLYGHNKKEWRPDIIRDFSDTIKYESISLFETSFLFIKILLPYSWLILLLLSTPIRLHICLRTKTAWVLHFSSQLQYDLICLRTKTAWALHFSSQLQDESKTNGVRTTFDLAC